MLKIIQREWQILLQERLMIFIVLTFAASAYALLIGNLYQGQVVQNIPVAVCDLDGSPLSRQLEQMVAEADTYVLTNSVTSTEEAEELLAQGKIAAALIIPKDFSTKYYHGEKVELAFLQDGSNTLQAGYVLAPMQSVCGLFAANYATQASLAAGTPELLTVPVNLSLRVTGNMVQGYLSFYIYGVMLMAAQIGMIMAFSMSIHEEWQQCPHSHKGIAKTLAAKGFFYWILSLIAVMLGITLLAGLFDLPFRGSMAEMLCLAGGFLFCVEGLAGLAGVYFKTKLALVQTMVFYTLPAFLISGYIWPQIGMTGIINWLSCLQPVHYILMDFRAMALMGNAPDFCLHMAVFLTIGTLAFMLLHVYLHLHNRDYTML